MFDITKRALDAALTATQRNRTASLIPDARKPVEQMQWITAQGAAAQILEGQGCSRAVRRSPEC